MFTLIKKVDLSSIGWEGCVLEFNSPSYNEISQIQKEASQDDKSVEVSDNIQAMIKGKLIGGEGMDGDKKVAVTKDNFDDLPFEVIMECIMQITAGRPDPNS